MALPEVTVNYLAILVSAIVSIILGSIWYGPLFGKTWMRLSGISKPKKITPEIKRMMIKSYIGMLISVLIMTCVLAHFMQYMAIASLMDAITLAFWIWLGFIATTMIGMVLWEGKPFKYYLINAGYYLIQLVVIANILFLWQ